MDRTITASEAKRRFPELLRHVAAGESFTILSRGKAVARVVGIDRASGQRSVQNLLKFMRDLPLRRADAGRRADLYE